MAASAFVRVSVPASLSPPASAGADRTSGGSVFVAGLARGAGVEEGPLGVRPGFGSRFALTPGQRRGDSHQRRLVADAEPHPVAGADLAPEGDGTGGLVEEPQAPVEALPLRAGPFQDHRAAVGRLRARSGRAAA